MGTIEVYVGLSPACSIKSLTSVVKDCAVNLAEAALTGARPAKRARSSTWKPAMWLTGRHRCQSPGPERNRSVARAEAVSASEDSATAFAFPVDPEVKRMRAGALP